MNLGYGEGTAAGKGIHVQMFQLHMGFLEISVHVSSGNPSAKLVGRWDEPGLRSRSSCASTILLAPEQARGGEGLRLWERFWVQNSPKACQSSLCRVVLLPPLLARTLLQPTFRLTRHMASSRPYAALTPRTPLEHLRLLTQPSFLFKCTFRSVGLCRLLWDT